MKGIDGSGYPHGMKYKDILMGSSIVAVVNLYDAMTTDRVYEKE
jgi:HD-GYP domain-containing protein (c-di-GMP phosphodiesterase class II)